MTQIRPLSAADMPRLSVTHALGAGRVTERLAGMITLYSGTGPRSLWVRAYLTEDGACDIRCGVLGRPARVRRLDAQGDLDGALDLFRMIGFSEAPSHVWAGLDVIVRSGASAIDYRLRDRARALTEEILLDTGLGTPTGYSGGPGRLEYAFDVVHPPLARELVTTRLSEIGFDGAEVRIY